MDLAAGFVWYLRGPKHTTHTDNLIIIIIIIIMSVACQSYCKGSFLVIYMEKKMHESDRSQVKLWP